MGTQNAIEAFYPLSVCVCVCFRSVQALPSGETIKAVSWENLTFLFLWGKSRWTCVCVCVCVCEFFFSPSVRRWQQVSVWENAGGFVNGMLPDACRRTGTWACSCVWYKHVQAYGLVCVLVWRAYSLKSLKYVFFSLKCCPATLVLVIFSKFFRHKIFCSGKSIWIAWFKWNMWRELKHI